jgi:hypothetical protein
VEQNREPRSKLVYSIHTNAVNSFFDKEAKGAKAIQWGKRVLFK